MFPYERYNELMEHVTFRGNSAQIIWRRTHFPNHDTARPSRHYLNECIDTQRIVKVDRKGSVGLFKEHPPWKRAAVTNLLHKLERVRRITLQRFNFFRREHPPCRL